MSTPQVHVRWMIRRDMVECLDIEGKSFSSPWIEEDFLRQLRARNVIGVVAEIGEKVVGHMVYELHKSRLFMIRFAVHPDYRRQGVGKTMLRKITSKLSSHRRNRLSIDVDEKNLAGQLFLRACGAEAIRVDKGGADDGDDSYRFVLRCPETQVAEIPF